jgi:transcriptional regulator with XRE-family HTH domain
MSSKYIQLELADRLKKVRSDLSLSQKEMADRLSIALSTYQYYERGQREAPVSFVCKIASFGVSFDWLLTGAGKPYTSIESTPSAIKHKRADSAPEHPANFAEITDTEIIEQFCDKKYARDLNLHLVELERLNSEAFKKVDPYIKGMLDGLRMKPTQCCMYKGPDRRTEERRGKDNPEKFKGAKDRRSGKDRRIAVNG